MVTTYEANSRLLFSITEVHFGALYKVVVGTNDRTEIYRNMDGTFSKRYYLNNIYQYTYVVPDKDYDNTNASAIVAVDTLVGISAQDMVAILEDNRSFVLNNDISLDTVSSVYTSTSGLTNNMGMFYSSDNTDSAYSGYDWYANMMHGYDELSSSQKALIAQIRNYMMRERRVAADWPIVDGEDTTYWDEIPLGYIYYTDNGDDSDDEYYSIAITNYRMLVFTVIYPWMDYDTSQVNDMYIPASFSTEEEEAATPGDVTKLYTSRGE